MRVSKIHESNLHNCEIWCFFVPKPNTALVYLFYVSFCLTKSGWSQCQPTYLIVFRFNGDFNISNYWHLHFNIMFYKFDQFLNVLGTCRRTFLQVITQQRIYTPVRISPAGVKSRWWVLMKCLLFVIMLLTTNFCNSFRNCKDVFSYNPHYAEPKSWSTWA